MHTTKELGELAARHAASLDAEERAAAKDYEAVITIGDKLTADLQQLNADEDLTSDGKQRRARELIAAAQTEAAKVTAPRFQRLAEQLNTEQNWTEDTLRRRLALDKDPVRAAQLAESYAVTLPLRSVQDLQALLTDAVNAGKIADAWCIHDALAAKLRELPPESQLSRARAIAETMRGVWPEVMRELPVAFRRLHERRKQLEHVFHRLSEHRIVRAPAMSPEKPENRLRDARRAAASA
ncbi:MAG: hypothetical protein ABSA52_21735 [Candidatus Binatia bacterium]|jgi:hypothetical protein